MSTLPAPGAALVATLRAARAGDADRITEIHLTARRTAMPWLARPHTDEETRTWVRGVLVPSGAVTVAERRGQVAGYTAVTDGWLEHLYVDHAAQGRGIGSALFAHAQALQPRGLRFWVFQRNAPALAFYARHGCVEVQRTTGEDNAEREPDVCLRWAPPA